MEEPAVDQVSPKLHLSRVQPVGRPAELLLQTDSFGQGSHSHDAFSPRFVSMRTYGLEFSLVCLLID